MKEIKIITLLISLVFLHSTDLFSQENNKDLPTGDEVAKRINARDEGETVSRVLIIELTDRKGKKRLRTTRTFRKYYGEEKRTIMFYKEPKNIKDTAFLTIDYPQSDKEDDQWLYLPALRKVRRISASKRGDYFLGTDFTYEDMKSETKVNIDDYNRTTIGEETIDGHHCYILEAVPINKKIAKELGYGKAHQWVDDKIWMTRKTIIWDIHGNLLKTIYFENIRKVQNIWTIHQINVENHKTKHNTLFKFKNIDYLTEIKDDLFTEQSLRRGLKIRH